MKKKLTEETDFYYNEDGYIVLTEKFHLEKGICCVGTGVKHCPYRYINIPEPVRTILLNKLCHLKPEE